MPWFPELFSASVVDRIRRDAVDARAAEPVRYFDGVRSGEIDALVGSFAGEPELHHPVRGRRHGKSCVRAVCARDQRLAERAKRSVRSC